MRLTNEEIRLDYLVETLGMKPSDALREIRNFRPTIAESLHIIHYRAVELCIEVVKCIKRDCRNIAAVVERMLKK